jgi:hypothetical protein
MIKRAILRITLIAGLLVSSCAGASLSRLQTEFNELYQEKEACLSQGKATGEDVTNVKGIPCIEQAEAAFFALAQSAKSAADSAEDQRTKIALLRLAGVSLWQSGRGTEKEANALVNRICLEGESICTAIEEKAKKGEIYGAPRDCALVAILPALVWHSEYDKRLEELKREPYTAQRREELIRIIENYPGNTVLFVSNKKKEVGTYTGLSPSVVDYIKEVERRCFCNFLVVEQMIMENKLGHEKYRDLGQRFDNQVETMSKETGLKRAEACR